MDVNRAQLGRAGAGARRLARLRTSPASPTTRRSSATSSRFDRPLLGSVDGLRGVHLQCHIGTDTVSLARLGARMTGLDFSPAALAEARRLAASAGADVEFVEADVYDAPRRPRPRRVRPRLHRHRGAHLAARHRPLGRRRRRAAAARRSPVHPRGPPDPVGARPTRARRAARPRAPLLRARRADACGTTRHVRRHRRRVRRNTSATSGTTASARSSPRCSTTACELTTLVEHDSVPWDALPGQMEHDRRRRVPPRSTVPSACRTRYTVAAVKRR